MRTPTTVFRTTALLFVLAAGLVDAVDVSVDAGSGEAVAIVDTVVSPNDPMSVRLGNHLEVPVDVYWIENAAREVLSVSNLAPGSSTPMQTYAGHAFLFTEAGKGRDGILQVVIMRPGTTSYSVTEEGVASSSFKPGADNVEATSCIDRKPYCQVSAERGECTRNPGWMIVNCPRSCKSCELLDPKLRCDRARLNISTSPAYEPGDMADMFAGLVEKWPELEPKVVSDSPWIVTFDAFMNQSETDALIAAVGAESGGPGFVRSTDTGAYNKFGEAEKVVSSGRTSENAWCRENCDNVPLVKSILNRIEAVLGIPYVNYEQFQVLRYQPGQYYRTHHDYGAQQVKLACGPRILTFFLYLSDVDEGGETAFPRLDIKVPPKRGKALLWPSVLSDDLLAQDSRTFHEALPVVKGLKLAANAWVHLYNFHTPNLWGCTGAFD